MLYPQPLGMSADPAIGASRIVDQFSPVPANRSRPYQPPARWQALAAKACQRAGGWYGLDLFAGTGLNWSTIRDAPIAGSALMPSGCGYSMRPQRTTSSCLDLGRASEREGRIY